MLQEFTLVEHVLELVGSGARGGLPFQALSEVAKWVHEKLEEGDAYLRHCVR
jgi:hypothetical protein